MMIEVLKVTSAFGTLGTVRARIFSDNILNYRCLFDSDDIEYHFKIVRFYGSSNAIVKFDTINDRTDAEKLRGKSFFIRRESLDSLTKDEFYASDLVGKEVFILSDENTFLPNKLRVKGIVNYGAGDLLELAIDDHSFLIPFTMEHFPSNDSILAIRDTSYKMYSSL